MSYKSWNPQQSYQRSPVKAVNKSYDQDDWGNWPDNWGNCCQPCQPCKPCNFKPIKCPTCPPCPSCPGCPPQRNWGYQPSKNNTYYRYPKKQIIPKLRQFTPAKNACCNECAY